MLYPDIRRQLSRLLKRSYGRVRLVEEEAGLPRGQLSRIAKGLTPRNPEAFHRALFLLGTQPETLYRQALIVDPESLLEDLPRPEHTPRWLAKLHRVARTLERANPSETKHPESHDQIVQDLPKRLRQGSVGQRSQWLRTHLPPTPVAVKAAAVTLEKSRHDDLRTVVELGLVLARDVCSRLQGPESRAAFASTLGTLGTALRGQGHSGLAAQVLLLAMRAASHAGGRIATHTLARVAYVLQSCSRQEQSLSVAGLACSVAGEQGDLNQLARMLAVRAALYSNAGRYSEAHCWAEQAMAGLPEKDRSNRFLLSVVKVGILTAAARCSRDAAVSLWAEIRRAEALSDPRQGHEQTLVRTLEGTACWLRQDHERASKIFREVRPRLGYLVNRVGCTISLMDALRAQGNVRELRSELCTLAGLVDRFDRSSSAQEAVLDLCRSDLGNLSAGHLEAVRNRLLPRTATVSSRRRVARASQQHDAARVSSA